MHIGVIATMKTGLEHFVYRELSLLSAQGNAISLFPTKFRHGLYNARPEWTVHRWNLAALILGQFTVLFQHPGQYFKLLAEALETGSLMNFAIACHFSRFMRDVDVIYVEFADHKLYVGYYCKKLTGKPLAVTIHAYELYQNPNPRMFVRTLPYCDQIITVTEYNRELLASKYHIDPRLVEVVRITVDVDDYRPEEKFVILIVAYFSEKKGHEILFRAVKQLDLKDIEIWVVGDGDGDDAVDVRRLAMQTGVDDQVAFFGKLSGNALKAVYHACDVFCLPSRTERTGISEGFPTVLAEAMAFGKPVITTRHVEIPRIVKDILVDENDVDGLAEAIRRAYESPELRRELGVQGRRIAEQHFSAANVARTSRILTGLIGASAGAHAAYPLNAQGDR
jgi:colanic acid/amylovoran biosynthesis glycosyltransferase